MTFASRDPLTKVWPDRQWTTTFTHLNHEFADGGERNLDTRTMSLYYFTGITPAMASPKLGQGAAYVYTARDAKGEWLDGSKNYKVTLPPNIPAARFWSFNVYDNQHRSLLETDQKAAGMDSTLSHVKKNADGSTTVWFGPKRPPDRGQLGADVAGQRLQRDLPALRANEGWFDKSWKPGDFELVKWATGSNTEDKVVKSSASSISPAALTGALAVTSAYAQTPDSVKTRLGTLDFERGYPTEETARKLYDEMDFQRAVQAFLWSFPAVSFESIRIGVKQDLGADLNDLIIADNFADTKGIWLTANDTTIYGMVNVDLGQGPIVVEVPAGPGVGLIDDFWQRAITDFGLPGPDQGKGGRYLLLPSGYTGEVPKEGYYVLRGTMNNYNIMNRGLVENNDIAAAMNLIKGMRVYPWSERNNPKPNKVVPCPVPRWTRLRLTASSIGRGYPRSSTTTPFTSVIAFHGHAQAAGHRKGQAVQARCAPTCDP